MNNSKVKIPAGMGALGKGIIGSKLCAGVLNIVINKDSYLFVFYFICNVSNSVKI